MSDLPDDPSELTKEQARSVEACDRTVERLREWANQADEVFDDVHHEAEKYETQSARDIY